MNPAGYYNVKRKNCIARLRDAVSSHSLVVVAAPMGYGKTTVAMDFLGRADPPKYFYSLPLDAEDGDGLWDSMWREMETQGMEEASALRRATLPKTPAETLAAVEILASAPPFLLILDDYHHCRDSALNGFIEAAARTETGHCRFLLFSRTLPEMELDELQFKGLAAVFDQALLTFSAYEAGELFAANGVADGSIAEKAWKYSEGWAAALWLCLRSTQKDGEMPPSKDIETLLDMVVYSPYSRKDKQFLLQLSLLDAFTPAEADAVTGEPASARRLSRLRAGNAFIVRDDIRRVYQFHSIFREFLHKRLEAEEGLDLPSLYRRTADCYAARRDFQIAYRLLNKAGREQDQVRILDLFREQNSEAYADCRRDEIHVAVQAIPWRIRLQNPVGYLCYLWFFINAGKNERHTAMVREAERRFGNAKNIPPKIRERLVGEIEYLRGVLEFNDLKRMYVHYEKACALLKGPSFLQYDRVSWSFSSPHITFLFLREPGGFLRLLDFVERKQGILGVLTGGGSTGLHAMGRVEYHLERAELDDAERLLKGLRELANWRKDPTLYLLTLFARSRLLLAKGRPAAAAALLQDATPNVEKTDYFEHILCLVFAKWYILGSIGRAERAPGWLTDERVFQEPYNVVHTHSLALAIHGKLLLAAKDYGRLAHLLDNSTECLGPIENLFGRIHRKIFEALLAKHRRDTDGAVRAIGDAIDLSRPDGIVLTFAEYGDSLVPLLRRAVKTAAGDAHAQKILAWCNRAARPSTSGAHYKKSLLTTREREIMRLVAKGKTTPRIAEKLRITEATVKKLLSIAYGRLGVHTRVEAVARFHELYGRRASQRTSA